MLRAVQADIAAAVLQRLAAVVSPVVAEAVQQWTVRGRAIDQPLAGERIERYGRQDIGNEILQLIGFTVVLGAENLQSRIADQEPHRGLMVPPEDARLAIESQSCDDAAAEIVLGEGPAALAAGLEVKNLARDAFRIRTIGQCVYIAGRDDRELDLESIRPRSKRQRRSKTGFRRQQPVGKRG